MRRFFPFFILALSIYSCNPEEQDPSFVYIDQYSFSTGPGEGTDSEKITEVWAYANDQVIGVFDLPANIPILEQGNTNLSFFAGIKNNGISSTRIKYPFYAGVYHTKNLTALSVDTIRPEFTYLDGVEIEQRDYDGNTPSMIPLSSNQGELSMLSNNDFVFEGERCGYYVLQAGDVFMSFKDDQNLNLESGVITFLELNYSCNSRFAVGLISNESGVDKKKLAVVINPTTNATGVPVWNKIYIDLGLIVRESPNAAFFETYFDVTPDNAGEKVELFLDNIKIVHF